MADAKTNPWLVGGIVVGAAVVFYFLYEEYQTSLAAQATASANATANSVNTATATGSSAGVVQSAIPDQISTTSPSYPTNAVVTGQGTVEAPVASQQTTSGNISLPVIQTI